MFNVGLLRCIYFPTVKLDSLERFQSSLSIMHIMLGDLSTMRRKKSTFQGQWGGWGAGISEGQGQGWVWGHKQVNEQWWWYDLLLPAQVYMSLQLFTRITIIPWGK